LARIGPVTLPGLALGAGWHTIAPRLPPASRWHQVELELISMNINSAGTLPWVISDPNLASYLYFRPARSHLQHGHNHVCVSNRETSLHHRDTISRRQPLRISVQLLRRTGTSMGRDALSSVSGTAKAISIRLANSICSAAFGMSEAD
jgi:hypothetical protein